MNPGSVEVLSFKISLLQQIVLYSEWWTGVWGTRGFSHLLIPLFIYHVLFLELTMMSDLVFYTQFVLVFLELNERQQCKKIETLVLPPFSHTFRTFRIFRIQGGGFFVLHFAQFSRQKNCTFPHSIFKMIAFLYANKHLKTFIMQKRSLYFLKFNFFS